LLSAQNLVHNSTNQNVPDPDNVQRRYRQKVIPTIRRTRSPKNQDVLAKYYGNRGVLKIGTLLFETFGQSAGFNSRLFQTNPCAFWWRIPI